MGLFDAPESMERGKLTKRGRAPKVPKVVAPVAQPPADPDEPTTLTLQHVHKINGKRYMGTVTVSRGIAEVLGDQDTRARAERANFLRTDKAVIIGPQTTSGRKVTELPAGYYDRFDEVLGGQIGADRVSGKGMTDLGNGPQF